MDISLQEQLCRKETLKEFENYLENTTNTLNDFVEKLGWSLDETPVNNILVKCPLNSEHRILPSKLDVHCQTCILKKNGYDSTHSLYPSYNFSTSSAQTIQIDEITQMQILKSAYEESNFTLNIQNEPRQISQSIERYCCDFTPDERRILYDNAVKNTKLPYNDDVRNELTGVDIFNKSEKPKTELDILQEQRDLKRRRAAYRGKRVHTDRKSYVEVLREVVEGLTNSLSQEDKSISIENSNNITETGSNNRLTYKYEGNRNYVGNPYTRWLNIDDEESKLLKYYEEKSKSSCQESNTSEIRNLKDRTDIKNPRKVRSKSKEKSKYTSEFKSKRSRRSRSRSAFNETNYTTFRRSRSPLKFKKTKFKNHNSRSKSKETTFRKSRSRSVSNESKHKLSMRSRSQSISTESKYKRSKRSRSQSNSLKCKHKKSKKHKTRSKSKECSSRKKASKNAINNYLLIPSNEEENTINLKSCDSHKKKKKHKSKSKRKRSKSPKRLFKFQKSIELCENFEDIPSTSYTSKSYE